MDKDEALKILDDWGREFVIDSLEEAIGENNKSIARLLEGARNHIRAIYNEGMSLGNNLSGMP